RFAIGSGPKADPTEPVAYHLRGAVEGRGARVHRGEAGAGLLEARVAEVAARLPLIGDADLRDLLLREEVLDEGVDPEVGMLRSWREESMESLQIRHYSRRARAILYLVSAFVSAPTAGLIIWAVLNRRGDPESRALGRQCGIISLIAGGLGLSFF